MSVLKRVAIAGATGNLGPAILRQVINGGLEVTVLTRKGGSRSFDSTVRVAEVDYESLESLTSALRGQDAVVSTLSAAALPAQLLLVEAAAKAGVKRFLPSEFGSNTEHPTTAKSPGYASKITVQNALKEQAAKPDGMTYTVVLNGPFLDWGIMVGFLADVKGKSVTLWDGGERVFSATTLDTVGRAVVNVLKNPEETKNRAVYIEEAAVSCKQLLAIGQRATGSEWKGNYASLNDHVAKGWAELEKPKPDPSKFVMNFVFAAIFGDGYGAKFEEEKLDNDLLGVKELTEADIEALIRKAAQ